MAQHFLDGALVGAVGEQVWQRCAGTCEAKFGAGCPSGTTYTSGRPNRSRATSLTHWRSVCVGLTALVRGPVGTQSAAPEERKSKDWLLVTG